MRCPTIDNQLEQVYGAVIPDVNLGAGKVTMKRIGDPVGLPTQPRHLLLTIACAEA
ncbi:hypothetical protein ACFL2H_01355 [Planctomycetota bacterium]